ncbi:MAG: ABC transporter substrate-binding protein [Anaerolineae bacterium]
MKDKAISSNRIGNQWIVFTLFVVLAMLLTACDCAPKTKTYTIGVINLSANLDESLEAFKEGMAELGYIEGENVTYIYEGVVTPDKLDAVAQGLVEADVDLILSLTTPATLAAQRATAGTDIPIVFAPVTDPVGAGIVDSLTNPGGNATGITYSSQEGRRLEWLLQVAPTIEQIYIVYNPADQSPVLALKSVSETATEIGVELITREATNQEEAKTAFENIPEEADAIFFLPDSVVNDNLDGWLEIAIDLGLPTSVPNMVMVERGHLTTYGFDLIILAREQAARLADQILRGTKPADLPVEMADFFSAINLQTAEVMGLDIPDEVLRQADIVIR